MIAAARQPALWRRLDHRGAAHVISAFAVALLLIAFSVITLGMPIRRMTTA